MSFDIYKYCKSLMLRRRAVLHLRVRIADWPCKESRTSLILDTYGLWILNLNVNDPSLKQTTPYTRQYSFNIISPTSLPHLSSSPHYVHNNPSCHHPCCPVEIALPLTHLSTPLSRIRLRNSPRSPIITPQPHSLCPSSPILHLPGNVG